MKRRVFCILTVLCLALSACAPAAPAESEPAQVQSISFTDDLDRTVTVEPPRRVAALIGSFADIWQLAGGGDTLVAAADDAWTSFDLNLGQDVIQLGGVKQINLEQLAAAQPDIAAKTIYCGPIDAFYDFKLGTLEYRSLRFETETLDEQDHQGVAVVNYTEREVPYTRVIEHKHFEFGTQDKTVITREYPADWKPGDEPYYPINDARNEALYKQYEELAAQEGDVIFAGRLGGYKYYDMDKAIAAAFELVRNELGVEPTEA